MNAVKVKLKVNIMPKKVNANIINQNKKLCIHYELYLSSFGNK